jgi:hypothetical protein
VPPAYATWLRTAIRLAGSGTLDRCSDLKLILSHAGGFVPFAAYRIAFSASPKGNSVDSMAQLKKFYFDTALSGMYEAYGIEHAQRASIDRGAAERLFPRLALSPSTAS